MNQKGVSILSLTITIIIIIILAAITMLASNDSIGQAQEVKFKNDLTEVVNALEVYNQRTHMYVDGYDRDELKWDGTSDRAENTAKLEDKVNEDRIQYFFTDEIPESLKGKMTIESGEIKIDKNYVTEYEWAIELYPNMAY